MEKIAVYCSWADARLLADSSLLSKLPVELSNVVQYHCGAVYLQELSVALLTSECTDKILCLYEPILPELLVRSLANEKSLTRVTRVLSVLSRALPYAPSLKTLTQRLLSDKEKHGLHVFSQTRQLDLSNFADQDLRSLLLSLFRLLSFDLESFRNHVAPIQLSSLRRHYDHSIRYLACRCLAIYMQLADAATQQLLQQCLPEGAILGEWEGRDIDYRLLSLHEELRWSKSTQAVLQARDERSNFDEPRPEKLTREDLSDGVVEIGSALFIAQGEISQRPSTLVLTETTSRNLSKIGHALLGQQPILLVGPSNCGKTALAREMARNLGKLESMVTISLNDQIDARTLLGLYSASATGKGFIWKPGILAQALNEGNWVLVEDLDRVPSEVLSVFVQVIEQRQLIIPSRKERIKAAAGFRLIATIRPSKRHFEGPLSPTFLGARHWVHVRIEEMTLEDVRQLLYTIFPLLRAFLPSVTNVLTRTSEIAASQNISRRLGLREIIRWCRRMNFRLQSAGVMTGKEAVPESVYDDFILDAIDCIVGSLASGKERSTVLSIIAEELHCSPQRLTYLVEERVAEFKIKGNHVRFGREVLSKTTTGTGGSLQRHPFARTRYSLALIESVASTIRFSEPLLLVGETGIGKTAVIQQAAASVGQKLIVINLSQQSETSDLIGAFKPARIRSIVLPLAETFNTLFDLTFSAKRNQTFLASIRKSLNKEHWRRLLLLWTEALTMAENAVKEQSTVLHPGKEQVQKKRRIDTTRLRRLRDQWANFASQLEELQKRLSSNNERFAFEFIEGKLVNALRNGDWVLLDEINLTTPETLDNISSIFNNEDGDPPSLLLPESGVTKRIMAHSNFRVFAAMNPATDIGKKELMPALRSRFVELYVEPPDRNLRDLVSLIKTYIGRISVSDQRMMSDLALLYQVTKSLALNGKLADGAGQKPHYSIRNLVRTVLYVVQHASVYSLRRAVYEGFLMSFTTTLNQESQLLLSPFVDDHIFRDHKNVRSSLNQTPKPPNDSQTYVLFRHHWISRGQLQPFISPRYVLTPFVERNLLNLARATSMKRFPILLQGPTSSGKTSMIRYLADMSGNKLVRINNHEHTDLQEYLGSYGSTPDGQLQYKDGVLVDALRNGHWVVLDELNLAPTEVLEALNRLLDDNRELFVPETQEVVRPHFDFMLFATQNPAGLYGGRKHLSRAFRNRFLELHFDDIPEEELEDILAQRSQIAPSFCSRIVSVYKRLSMLRQTDRIFEQSHSFATLRDLFRWAQRPADDKEQLAKNGFMLLVERVRDNNGKLAVKRVIEDVFKIAIDQDALYNDLTINEFLPQEFIVWTPAMKRLLVLLSAALKNNEPVLLIGETGTGKTQLCQVLAGMRAKRLKTLNAHINTEAGDLIGAQRPIRNRVTIEHELRRDILSELEKRGIQIAGLDDNLESLVAQFNALQSSDLGRTESSILSKIHDNIAHARALFEWSDGILVKAMKDGHYFLFDEISLADDSVLERLNSVLEPSRTLLLAEKGTEDAEVVAAPDFQFLATMNPGGDYGKRELSAALRNRLTEIWVPPLHQDQDVVPIVHGKLRRGPPTLAGTLVDFAKWFRFSFYSSVKINVSLRDLLSWVDFVNTETHLELISAVFHGALLVFIDALGTNAGGDSILLAEHVLEAQQRSIMHLGQLLGQDLSIYSEQSFLLTINSAEVKLGDFSFPRSPTAKDESGIVFEAPTTMTNMLRIVRAMRLSKPILLEGRPGVGKTAIVTALAELVGKHLTRINLSDQTDLMDLFGSDVPLEDADLGQFAWRDGAFLTAFQTGGWVLLDEMNLASQSVLEGLNACVDHRQEAYIAELDRTFDRHPEFVLFATQNPHHHGGGRKGLPASFLNRFTIVYADMFHDEDLCLIAQRKFPDAPSSYISGILTFLHSFNEQASTGAPGGASSSLELNLRDVLRWLSLCKSTSYATKPYRYLDIIVKQRLRVPTQREQAESMWLKLFPEGDQNASYFNNLDLDYLQVGLGFLQRDRFLQNSSNPKYPIQKDHLPVMESLLLSVNNSWPTILVGPSGSGKSAILETLAGLCGADVVSYSLSRDTDASDLVGSFEQLDYARPVQEHVRKIASFARKQYATQIANSPSFENDDWLHLYSAAAGSSDSSLIMETIPPDLLQSSVVQQYRETLSQMVHDQATNSKVQFKWVEGQLIEAIVTGKWLVLDNANLCNPSVLDRLNSLLEFDARLIVSEQCTANGSPQILRPHPDFRIFLTMDPRNGELSRAMRNRSIEIFVDPTEVVQSLPRTPLYACDASIYRMRCLQLVESLNEPNEMGLSMARSVIDHLSAQDVGLLDTPPFQEAHVVWQTFKLYQTVLKSYERFPTPVNTLQHFDPTSLSNSIPHRLSAENQPLHPLTNEPLLSLRSTFHGRADPDLLGWLQERYLGLERTRVRIHDAESAAQKLHLSEMSVLQKSMSSLRIGSQSRVSSSALANSVIQLLSWFQEVLAQVKLHTLERQPKVEEQLDRLWTSIEMVLSLTDSLAVPEARLRAYLENLKQLALEAHQTCHTFWSRVPIAESITLQDWTLKTGRSLQRLWIIWKPTVPSDIEQLNAIEDLRDVARKLDLLPFSDHVTLPQKTSWRSNIAMLGNEILGNNLSGIATIIELRSALENIGSKPLVTAKGSHLRFFFEAMCQVHELSHSEKPEVVETHLSETINTLAGRPIDLQGDSRVNSSISATMHRISSIGGWCHPESQNSAMTDVFNLYGLRSLDMTHEQPLSGIRTLRSELEIAAQAVGSFPFATAELFTVVLFDIRTILHSIAQSHSDLFEIDMDQFLIHSKFDLDPFYRTVVENHLGPALRLLRNADAKRDDLFVVGAALFSTSLACLHLLVPDKLFDPALKLTVEREHYLYHLRQLDTKATALETFEKAYSGLHSNLRSRLTRGQIVSMGNAPPPASVVRFDSADLQEIQIEFKSIIQVILKKQLESIILSSIDGPYRNPRVSYDDRIQEHQLLFSNIARMTARLSRTSPVYHDMTVPVIRLLQSLELGARLVTHSERGMSIAEKAISSLAEHTPLMGSKPESICRRRSLKMDGTVEHRFQILEILFNRISIEQSLLQDSSKHLVLMDALDSFFSEWKQHLRFDQAESEKQAKFYHYKGEDASADDADFQVHSMFPETNEDNPPQLTDSQQYDPSATASRLAAAVAKLHLQRTNFDVQALVEHTCNVITRIARRETLEKTSASSQDLIPALLLKLEKLIQETQVFGGRRSIDIYYDSDWTESEKLYDLVRRIRARFSEIAESWPEHASPRAVLAYIDEILQTKISEPVIRLLTRAEKLHSLVYEWEIVASRSFSAVLLCDELKNTIVGWRRLEMLSWSVLLDKEDRSAQQAARAWWFMLYETIIWIPRQLPAEELSDHIRGMLGTLNGFLAHSPLGQFTIRAKMIADFRNLLATLTPNYRQLTSVKCALSNLLRFYFRFEQGVKQTLVSEREKLARNIKEQIRLASWRDTNIVALRESAKKSHYKLFKIVRQYRLVLARPFQRKDVIIPVVPQRTHSFHFALQDSFDKPDDDTLQLLRSRSGVFGLCLQRFEDCNRIEASMRKLYHRTLSKFDAAEELDSIRTDLLEAVSQLRNETPMTLSEDNRRSVKELGTRKRRYFAETLQTLRQIGIRQNLSGAELQQQDSITKILATTPDVAHDITNMQEADEFFDGFLDLIPLIRERAHDFSEDLTPSQMGRSIGFAEGLLYTIRKQKEKVYPFAASVQVLDDLVLKLKNLRPYDLSHPPIRQLKSDERTSTHQLLRAVCWLPRVLSVSVTTLEIQQRYTGIELSEVIGMLKTKADAIEEIQGQIKHIEKPQIASLRTGEEIALYENANLQIQSLKMDLEQAAAVEPRVAYITQQLIPWAETGRYLGNEYHNDMASGIEEGSSTTDVTAFSHRIYDASSSVLVAIQQLNPQGETEPTSSEDARWLVKADTCLVRSLKALHMDQVVHDFESALTSFSMIDEMELQPLLALCLLVLPTLQQYRHICHHLLERYTMLHRETCRLSFELGRIFLQIIREGFCGPSDGAAVERDENAKLEDGTGLGEGEGAQDMSKDIGDGEDISELANQQTTTGGDDDIESAEDAVDMGREDLEGEMDEIGEGQQEDGEDDQRNSEDEVEDMDEEAGDVDDLDPSAVDEKLWEGPGKEEEKELANEKTSGENNSEKQASEARNAKTVEEVDERDGNAQDENDDGNDEEAGSEGSENDAVGDDQTNYMDPRLQQETPIELPEDMQLDGDKRNDNDSLSDELGSISDIEEEGREKAEVEANEETDGDEQVSSQENRSVQDLNEAELSNNGDEDDMEDAGAQADDKDQIGKRDEKDQAEQSIMDNETDAKDESGKAGLAEEATEDQKSPANGEDSAEVSDMLVDKSAQIGQEGEQEPGRDKVAAGTVENSQPSLETEVFKSLGDIFERWHQQRREILQRSEQEPVQQNEDVELANVDFEHVENEGDEGETQAVGSASADQARSLDYTKAIEDANEIPLEDHPMPDIEDTKQSTPERPSGLLETSDRQGQDAKSKDPTTGAMIGSREIPLSSQSPSSSVSEADDNHSVSSAKSPTFSHHSQHASPSSAALWPHYSHLTHAASLQLTTQLALLLPATTAAKLRGDFRTGKRLNMKRIIPFIASSYRRDKIWLRRSAPSKRNYQILLAIDDSGSMAEGGGRLAGKALEMLALVAKALSGLEVGDLGVLAFSGKAGGGGGGDEAVRVAHELGTPFTEQAGPGVFGRFGFNGNGTDVKRLVQKSVEIFREARERSYGSGGETWQLELIVSDGIFDDHAEIARLVRLAQAERILFVFVLVDTATVNAGPSVGEGHGGTGPQQQATSILDLKRAVFEPDPITGEAKLVMKRYLEGFPFPYYVVVREVSELPRVLCDALRGWFREIGMVEG